MARSPCVDFAGARRIIGCATATISLFANTLAAACNAPQRPMQQIELMFGCNVTGHVRVGKVAWSRFLAREITPRLRRELSRMVIIVTADNAAASDQIATIVAAYKQQFRQRSVGVISHAVCAAF